MMVCSEILHCLETVLRMSVSGVSSDGEGGKVIAGIKGELMRVARDGLWAGFDPSIEFNRLTS